MEGVPCCFCTESTHSVFAALHHTVSCIPWSLQPSLLYFLQTWDSYSSTPLADSSPCVILVPSVFTSSTFRHWEPSPWKCPTVANTVPEILSVFCTRGKAIPSMSEYWRPVVPFWHADRINQTFIVSEFQGPEVRTQGVALSEGRGAVKGNLGQASFPASGGLLLVFGAPFFLFITLISAFILTWGSPCVCVSVSSFCKDNSYVGSTLMASF